MGLFIPWMRLLLANLASHCKMRTTGELCIGGPKWFDPRRHVGVLSVRLPNSSLLAGSQAVWPVAVGAGMRFLSEPPLYIALWPSERPAAEIKLWLRAESTHSWLPRCVHFLKVTIPLKASTEAHALR